MADNHHALAFKLGQPAHDGVVVGIVAVAVQLFKISAQRFDVVEGVGALRMARNLHNLSGSELGKNIFGKLVAFLLQAFDFFGNIQYRVVLHEAQLFYFLHQFGNGLFEIEKNLFHVSVSLLRLLPMGGSSPS